MRIAILSDIHSNLEALERALGEVERRKADKVIMLGDIVGYGADPNPCLELCRDSADIMIMGNHDKAAFHTPETLQFSNHAAKAALWTAKCLSKENKDTLSSLPLTHSFQDMFFVHASPDHPEKWNYLFSHSDAGKNFSSFTEGVCFIGHTHLPGVFTTKSHIRACEEIVTLSEDERYIINVGSVGQPRDRNPMLSLGMYDTNSREFEWIRLDYNREETARKIRESELPDFLADRLFLGT